VFCGDGVVMLENKPDVVILSSLNTPLSPDNGVVEVNVGVGGDVACIDVVNVLVDLFSVRTVVVGVTTYAVDAFSGFCSDVDMLL